ncbi:hypothetical protein RN001_012971, partial [Aquatica leii]
KMATKESSRYILPSPIATTLICSDCCGYLSCGPITMKKDKYFCGRCSTKNNIEGVPQPIFEAAMAKFTFPCKYYKEGCTTTVLFNHAQKHQSKCLYRMIICPGQGCSEVIMTSKLYDHFQRHHTNSIIDDDYFVLNLNCNEQQNVLMYESDCIVIVRYCYSRATKSLRLGITPCNEKIRLANKYKLKISNGTDMDNNISLGPKLCHSHDSYNSETGKFDEINIGSYLTILNNPKTMFIKISLIYSENNDVTTTNATDELNDNIEEEATKTLQNYDVTHNYNYNIQSPIVPCQWKGCLQKGKQEEILKHQEECNFKLHICPFLENCNEGLFKFNSFFFNHLETHGQYCTNPNKIEILLYNPNILYSKDKVNHYFINLNQNIVRITCTIETSGNWTLVCASSIDVKINVYFSHDHCRMSIKAKEETKVQFAEYRKCELFLSDCFVEYPRLKAVLKIEAC